MSWSDGYCIEVTQQDGSTKLFDCPNDFDLSLIDDDLVFVNVPRKRLIRKPQPKWLIAKTKCMAHLDLERFPRGNINWIIVEWIGRLMKPYRNRTWSSCRINGGYYLYRIMCPNRRTGIGCMLGYACGDDCFYASKNGISFGSEGISIKGHDVWPYSQFTEDEFKRRVNRSFPELFPQYAFELDGPEYQEAMKEMA